MWLSDTSVRRPVLATVASLLLIAFGLISFDRMSLREYPQTDAPVVTITTSYLGASAQVVESRITKLIESRIAGISGIDTIESSSYDGGSRIKVRFDIARDIDDAANDLRDRVSGLLDRLPEQATAPEIEKADSDDTPVLWFNLVSDHLSIPELTDYAERNLVDAFSSINGVARVRVGGGQSYALRIWLNPSKMANFGVTALDIEEQLRSANLELPVGALQGDRIMLTLQVNKPLTSVNDFRNLIIKQNHKLGQLRLSDVARVELGAIEKRRILRGNGLPMVGIGIIKQSNANVLEVAEQARARKDLLKHTLPKGMEIKDSYDASIFVHQAVDEVYKTLLISLGLVVLVILLFLRSFRVAMVPLVTIPVSLIATFWILWMLNYSVNLLTLLALVLAIGLVVDDAIVVLENTQRHLDKGYPPIAAAYLGTRQVGFAVIATTFVLVAVFMPIAFLKGSLGRLFSEFAVTLSIAVLFSSWVALTLSPALSSNLLRNRSHKKVVEHTKRSSWPARIFHRLLMWNLRMPWIAILIFFATLLGGIQLLKTLPQEYTPKEDRGVFYVVVKGPEGATFDYMKDYMAEIEHRLMPLVNKGEAKRLLVRSPISFNQTEIFNNGMIIVVLNDWSQRRNAQAIMEDTRKNLADLTGVRVTPIMRSAIGGRVQSPVQFVLGGPSYEQLAQWKNILDQSLAQHNPGLTAIQWDYLPNKPRLRIQVDYERANQLGITHKEIAETLQILLGSKKVTTYPYQGEEYDIYLQADQAKFESPKDLKNIYIRSPLSDEMVPLASIIHFQEEGVASSLNRYNRTRAITLSANLEPNLSLGEALNYLNRLVKDKLPRTATIDYKGTSKEFFEGSDSLWFVFAFSLAVVYFVLAAQFESFRQPLIIMVTVPLALTGGILALDYYGLSLNIYSQIALIMLLGLATKNGILIVEFANQLRDQGAGFYRALIQATQLRVRPIMMTAITTIAGAVPLILSTGAGSESRHVLGMVLFWGVAFSTFLSIFIVPVFYALISRQYSTPLGRERALETALKTNLK